MNTNFKLLAVYFIACILLIIGSCKKQKSLKPIAEGKPVPVPFQGIIPPSSGGGGGNNGGGNNGGGGNTLPFDSLLGFSPDSNQLCAGLTGNTDLIPLAKGNVWFLVSDFPSLNYDTLFIKITEQYYVIADTLTSAAFEVNLNPPANSSLLLWKIYKFTYFKNSMASAANILTNIYLSKRPNGIIYNEFLSFQTSSTPLSSAYDTSISVKWLPETAELIDGNIFSPFANSLNTFQGTVETANYQESFGICTYNNALRIDHQFNVVGSNPYKWSYKKGIGFLVYVFNNNDRYTLKKVRLY